MSVTVGMKCKVETLVCEDNTAVSVGSGTLPVFATPYLCALMEEAAWKAIAPCLEEGDSSVGTQLTVSHLSATPIGLKVWAEAEVVGVEGKRVDFKVTAGDEKGPIGEGTHQRFIVTNDRFLAKAARKLEG